MNKVDLGPALTGFANVGILLGIFLLVYELAQNRQMMEAQTRRELSASITNQLLVAAESAEFNNFIYRVESGEPITDEERRRYWSFAFARIRTWEDVHYHYRIEFFD